MWALLLLFLPTVLGQDYCSLCASHTMCTYQGLGQACGSNSQTGVTPEESKQIIQSHNYYRAQVANGQESRGAPGPQPPAANMQALIWDDKLAEVAQRWADQCIFEHDKCRDDPRFPVGQNIYWSSGFSNVDWERAVKAWYDEVAIYSGHAVGALRFSEATGHYTQLLWAQSKYVGCARRTYGGVNFAAGGKPIAFTLAEARNGTEVEEGTETKLRPNRQNFGGGSGLFGGLVPDASGTTGALTGQPNEMKPDQQPNETNPAQQDNQPITGGPVRVPISPLQPNSPNTTPGPPVYYPQNQGNSAGLPNFPGPHGGVSQGPSSPPDNTVLFPSVPDKYPVNIGTSLADNSTNNGPPANPPMNNRPPANPPMNNGPPANYPMNNPPPANQPENVWDLKPNLGIPGSITSDLQHFFDVNGPKLIESMVASAVPAIINGLILHRKETGLLDSIPDTGANVVNKPWETFSGSNYANEGYDPIEHNDVRQGPYFGNVEPYPDIQPGTDFYAGLSGPHPIPPPLTGIPEPLKDHRPFYNWFDGFWPTGSNFVGYGDNGGNGGNGGSQQILICNYGPAGNYLGDAVYAVGQACSQCPEGTSCSNGLCA